MNIYAIRALYQFEMARTWRTLMQSIASPVISTSLYFVVFGAAIGSRMVEVDGVRYGAFIVPGLIMMSLMTQSVANASFGIYMPKFSGTIYEILSAPISAVEIVLGYVGAAASKSVILGLLILATARLFVDFEIVHPVWMLVFLVLTAVAFSLLGFIIGIWADGFEKVQIVPMLVITPLSFLGGSFYSLQHAAAVVAEGGAVQSRGLPDQRLPLELLRRVRRQRGAQRRHGAGLPGGVHGRDLVDLQDRLQAARLKQTGALVRRSAFLTRLCRPNVRRGRPQPFLHTKKKLAEASSVPMYYQCFNQVSSAHAICVVRRCVNRPTYPELQTRPVATIYESQHYTCRYRGAEPG